MRVLTAALKLAAAAVASTAMCSSACAAEVAAVAAPAPSIAGAWRGPFLSTNFMFEFSQAGDVWTGRYQSERSGRWVDIRDISFTDGTLSFSFQTQPPASFTLKMDAAGKALNGSAKFGELATLPLTLTRHPERR